MKFKYILIAFVLLAATVFIAGCASEKVHLNIKYLYIPGDINGERVLSELNNLADKYPDSITLTKVSRINGVPQEFKDLGVNETMTAPVMIINNKLYRTSGEIEDLLSGRTKLPS
jgi:hypothetical protein